MSPFILLAVSALSGQAPQPKPVEYPFKQIERGGFSRIREQRVFVIKSAEDYQAYNKTFGREPPAPKVDWHKNQIVAVHIGSAPSTGYGVVVWRIVKTGPTTVNLEVLRTTPPPGTMQAMHITYPYVLVTTPRFTERIKLTVLAPGDPGDVVK
jgi:hypothetical protein